jgi:hypothetical protein
MVARQLKLWEGLIKPGLCGWTLLKVSQELRDLGNLVAQ